MGYISKLDMRFLTYMNRKYRDKNVKFEYYDDYALFLYDLCKKDDEEYYICLEEDLREYVEMQSGKEK
jgi:hypothetical protein